jgi:hypothetical protein
MAADLFKLRGDLRNAALDRASAQNFKQSHFFTVFWLLLGWSY